MRRALGAGVLATALLAAACGRPARPPVMADTSREAESAAAKEAAALAPEAHAHAEKLRRDADAAYAAGDLPGAQVLSERALAAYQHALVLARIVRANRAAAEATDALAKAQAELARREADLARVTAEADDVEMRIRVARDAAPLARSQPSDPAREAARLAAARSLATDARLLCVAVKMLAKEPPAGLAEAEKQLVELDGQLAAPPRPAPVDAAARARAKCLDLLTRVRRDANATSSVGRADELLSELSAMDAQLAPSRDDRGVVVSLRLPFRGDALAPQAESRLKPLGRVAAAHPTFPVQVVVHGAGKHAPARGQAIAQALAKGGGLEVAAIRVEDAGDRKPLVDPHASRDKGRNERVEVVFVSPGG